MTRHLFCTVVVIQSLSLPRASILCLSVSISHVYSVNIFSYFTELEMRNIVFLGALALVSASDDQSCYAHISVSSNQKVFQSFFLFR